MIKLIPINDLFEAVYGVNLELINLEICNSNDPQSIRFISRKESDNGLSAYVKLIDSIEPNPAHTLSVAVSGSVLSTFYQDKEYYSGRDVYYLLPRQDMSVEEMLFYAFCLQKNKYKYNYGRAANRTLREILVPAELPLELKKISLSHINVVNESPVVDEPIQFKIENWNRFSIEALFVVKKGKRLTKEDMDNGTTPFIGAIDSNNGYRDYIGQEPIHEGNTITVNYNGSVAEAFYQPFPFWASDDVNVLYPKFEMNVYIGLFIATIIEREKYRFNFGRKWHKERMEKSLIALPAINGKPDFAFMENYIKSLPFSSAITILTKDMIKKPLIKETKVNKGISDAELVRKYESGGIDLEESLKRTYTPDKNTLSQKTKKAK